MSAKERNGLHDDEKAFCPDGTAGNDVFAMRQIDPKADGKVIVRSDRYTTHILPIDDYEA